MTDWLIDASALVRLGNSPRADTWAERIDRGLVRIATVTRLEVGYSARSGRDLRAAALRPPLAAMPNEYQTPAIEDRAVHVQTLLAELAGLTVLHSHKDFDLIADITGQPTEQLLS